MYISVKGGQDAIAAAARLLDQQRRGDLSLPELGLAQLQGQLGLLVDRVMAEASLHDRELAALAIKQACGDPVEAVFLLRAYRTTLPRLGDAQPLDTSAMRVQRRVSAIFKDLPGGQLLGATFDYTQRLLDFGLAEAAPGSAQADSTQATAGSARDARDAPAPDRSGAAPPATDATAARAELPNPLDELARQGLIEPCRPSAGDPVPSDITREPPLYPLARTARLQMLARADEGWLLGLAYATQRGYSHTHPFAGEVRHGAVAIEFVPDELGFAITLGEVELTECQMVNQIAESSGQAPQFTRGQGLVFGHGERKAMAMALVDRALRADELGEERSSVMQDQEFVLPHGDNVEASGFVQHLKLPHYVTFESELGLLRALRAQARQPGAADAAGAADAGACDSEGGEL
jgi:alpha-D-ribose 1-methylphosphonate 5-triphosphate synthase subunit PhnI